jgi:hypothetical protein
MHHQFILKLRSDGMGIDYNTIKYKHKGWINYLFNILLWKDNISESTTKNEFNEHLNWLYSLNICKSLFQITEVSLHNW